VVVLKICWWLQLLCEATTCHCLLAKGTYFETHSCDAKQPSLSHKRSSLRTKFLLPHPIFPTHLTLYNNMNRQARASLAARPVAQIFHSAASKSLAKARAASPPSSPSPVSSSSSPSARCHVYPDDGRLGVLGARFEVDFDQIYLDGAKLSLLRTGFKVSHKSKLIGARKSSPVWQYGLELEHYKASGKRLRLWLCKACHLTKHHTNDAMKVDGNAHITRHMINRHGIDPATGMLPEGSLPGFTNPFEAAKVAGAGTMISHSPWQEEELQGALVDWVMLKDVSFSTAVSPAFRGLLTWNRSSLLAALPDSKSTMSSYVMKLVEKRKGEVKDMLAAAKSKISLSVDIWTSSNYLSFLGVVAHFVGKLAISLLIACSHCNCKLTCRDRC